MSSFTPAPIKPQITFGDHQRQILAGMKNEREDLDALALPERSVPAGVRLGQVADAG